MKKIFISRQLTFVLFNEDFDKLYGNLKFLVKIGYSTIEKKFIHLPNLKTFD